LLVKFRQHYNLKQKQEHKPRTQAMQMSTKIKHKTSRCTTKQCQNCMEVI